eukprot:scaffold39311_cov67-Phaeocystis_antarctica.AAC.2
MPSLPASAAAHDTGQAFAGALHTSTALHTSAPPPREPTAVAQWQLPSPCRHRTASRRSAAAHPSPRAEQRHSPRTRPRKRLYR